MVFQISGTNQFVIRHQYDATENIKNLLNFRATILPRTLRCTEFWVACVVHYILYFVGLAQVCTTSGSVQTCQRVRDMYSTNLINLGDIVPIVNVVVFFLVFYNGNCFSRFVSLYQLVCLAGGKLHGASLFLRDYFDDPVSRWQVMRYMLASHRIFFYVLRKQFAEWYGFGENSALHPGSWDHFAETKLIPMGLLMKEEADWLREYGGNKHKPCLSWSAAALKHIIDNHDDHPKTGYTYIEGGVPMKRDGLGAPTPRRTASSAGGGGGGGFNVEGFNWAMDRNLVLSQIMDCIQGMLGAITQAEEMWLLPVPFYYYHLLNLSLVMVLILLGYAFLFINAGGGSGISLIAFPFCAMILVALRETASAMATPFGENKCDFCLEAFQETVYRDCKAICMTRRSPFYTRIGDKDWIPPTFHQFAAAAAAAAAAHVPPPPAVKLAVGEGGFFVKSPSPVGVEHTTQVEDLSTAAGDPRHL